MIGFYILMFFAYLFRPAGVHEQHSVRHPDIRRPTRSRSSPSTGSSKLVEQPDMLEGCATPSSSELASSRSPCPSGSQLRSSWRSLPPGAYSILIAFFSAAHPGVIIGISTVIFWKDVIERHGKSPRDHYKGSSSRAGQSSFIWAYCMPDHHGAVAAVRPGAGRGRTLTSAAGLRRSSRTSCCRS